MSKLGVKSLSEALRIAFAAQEQVAGLRKLRIERSSPVRHFECIKHLKWSE